MKLPNQAAMVEALRLTRAGKLAEATGLIQATLARAVAPSRAAPVHEGVTIDVSAIRVPPPPPPPPLAGATAAPGAAPTAETAGRFEERLYTGPTGRLSYMLYVPADAAPGLPLVVMLHGCTQSPEDFARGTGMNALADELGLIVAWPRQAKGANAQGCWNWYRPGDQKRDAGEPALIAGITREVIAETGADPARVYVAGLSAGGATAAIMAAAYPDLYAAVGVHSGLASGAAGDLSSALSAMRQGPRGGARGAGGVFVPVITFHGDRDHVVHETNSADIIATALAGAAGPLHTSTETGRTPGGRAFTREISADGEGRATIERWTVHGAGHAWAGGDASGSYTDPSGPDASREMVRFFLRHARSETT